MDFSLILIPQYKKQQAILEPLEKLNQKILDDIDDYYNMLEKGTDAVIPFVIKGQPYSSKTSSYYVETCEVNISLSVQVVQANRYEALWGISSIPQPTE